MGRKLIAGSTNQSPAQIELETLWWNSCEETSRAMYSSCRIAALPGIKRGQKEEWNKLKDAWWRDTHECLANLTLAPGKLENPVQIFSFGVPRTLKIWKEKEKKKKGSGDANESTGRAEEYLSKTISSTRKEDLPCQVVQFQFSRWIGVALIIVPPLYNQPTTCRLQSNTALFPAEVRVPWESRFCRNL